MLLSRITFWNTFVTTIIYNVLLVITRYIINRFSLFRIHELALHIALIIKRGFSKKQIITSATICPLLIVSCSGSWDIAIDLKVDPMLTCPQFALALSTFWHNELLLLPGPPVNIKTSVFNQTQRSLNAFFANFPVILCT